MEFNNYDNKFIEFSGKPFNDKYILQFQSKVNTYNNQNLCLFVNGSGKKPDRTGLDLVPPMLGRNEEEGETEGDLVLSVTVSKSLNQLHTTDKQ
jgi:hypothetical protein